MINPLLLKMKSGDKSSRNTTHRVYSSRGNSSQRSSIENEESYRTSSSRKSRSSSMRQKRKLIFPESVLKSVSLIKQKKLTPELNQIQESCHRVLESNTRQDRQRLVDVLLQLHPFFNKIHPSIAEAIVLLGKPIIYYKDELIFSPEPAAPKSPQEQSFYRSSPPSFQEKPLHQVGFLLYGKMQLRNDKIFYSHRLFNEGTLFQNSFIAKNNRVEYYAQAMGTCFVLWVSKPSYYVIRKECFLSLDLKYKFGEFENLLKLNTVTKKLPTVEEIKKILIEPK